MKFSDFFLKFLTGFDSSIINITFGSSICNPVMITYEEIHCITESSPSLGVEHIKIYLKDGNTITSMKTFEFLKIDIGDITSLSSSELSVAGSKIKLFTPKITFRNLILFFYILLTNLF